MKNGLIQSPFVGSTSDLTKFYAQSLASHFETYKNVLALDGAGILVAGDKIHIDNKKLPTDTKDWYIVQANVSITTDGADFNKLATCQYSAIAVADNVENLANNVLDEYKQTKFTKEGFAIKGYTDDQDDASTLNESGKYQLEIPKYYQHIDEDEVINDVAKLHFVHSPDQKHSFPLVDESPILHIDLQDPTILGPRNTDTRPSSNRKGFEQDYRLADNKQNSLNFIHSGAFKHNIANPKAKSSVVLESQKYRSSNRSAAIRLGDESYKDIHKGKKAGMSLQSEGNFYELHPNYKATLYGNRNNTDAQNQSISPIYGLVTQKLNSDEYPYHWLEGVNADEYHTEIVADSSNLTTQVKDNIVENITATNIIDKYTNKVTQDIYLNTDETYSTDNQHNLEFNEVNKNISVEGEITQETQAKKVQLSSNEAINTLYHTQKNTNVDGDVNLQEVKLEQNVTNELTLAGGIEITANTLINNVPDGINIIAKNATINAEQLMSYGSLGIVNDDPGVEQVPKPKCNRVRIHIMDRFYTQKAVPSDDDYDKNILKTFIDRNYIQAKAFDSSNTLVSCMMEYVNRYFEMQVTEEAQYVAIEIAPQDISNQSFQSLVVGINGQDNKQTLIEHSRRYQNTVSLQKKDWSDLTTTETINDIDTTIGNVIINVLEPPMMVNLREDYYFDYYKTQIFTLYKIQNWQLKDDTVNDATIQQINVDLCDKLKSYQKQQLKTAIDKYNNLKQRYSALADNYFDNVSYTAKSRVIDDNFWQEYLYNFAKKNNNNLTFFIHGYNVPIKDQLGYPDALVCPDSKYDIATNEIFSDAQWSSFYDITGFTLDKSKVSVLSSDEAVKKFNTDMGNIADGACKWHLEFEYSLNKAAGWDEKYLFEDYSRIVQVAWQGNPSSELDYSAAIAMSEFAGQQLAKVINDIKAKDSSIKINILAHSLGNAVVMNTLKGLNSSIEHTICWEPAIANDSLGNVDNINQIQHLANSYLQYNYDGSQEFNNTKQMYNVSYNYAGAKDKADKFTIAYSQLDGILGPIPNIPNLFGDGEIAKLSYSEIRNRIVVHMVVCIGSYYYNYSKIPTDWDNSQYKNMFLDVLLGSANLDKYPEAKVIQQKLDDSGAGIAFGATAAFSYAIDAFLTQSISDKNSGGFKSIYNIANKFIYPFNYFISGDMKLRANDFYKQWKVLYPTNNASKLATDDLNHINSEEYQNLNIRELLQSDKIQHGSNFEKENLFDVCVSALEKLLKYLETGILDVPGQVIDNLEETLSNIFSQNPLTTVWDTATSFFEPAANYTVSSAASLTGLTQALQSSGKMATLKNIIKNKETMLAMVFTVLMQKDNTNELVQPAPAMGWGGIDQDSQVYKDALGKTLFQTPQEVDTASLSPQAQDKYPCYYVDTNKEKHIKPYNQMTELEKQTAKSMLCVDHSAMLEPTDEFMDWIYRGVLFGERIENAWLDFFGRYDLTAIRKQNMENLNKQSSMANETESEQYDKY